MGVQDLRNNLTSNRSDIMQICIPQLQHRLLLKPPLIHQQRIHHTCIVVLVSSLPGFARSFHHGVSDNPTVRFRDLALFQLAGYAFFD